MIVEKKMIELLSAGVHRENCVITVFFNSLKVLICSVMEVLFRFHCSV